MGFWRGILDGILWKPLDLSDLDTEDNLKEIIKGQQRIIDKLDE